MGRIHLFEFEDLPWFPNWLRQSLARLIVVMHRILGTPDEIAKFVEQIAEKTGQRKVVDLCSGSGGPMPVVFDKLNSEGKIDKLLNRQRFRTPARIYTS